MYMDRITSHGLFMVAVITQHGCWQHQKGSLNMQMTDSLVSDEVSPSPWDHDRSQNDKGLLVSLLVVALSPVNHKGLY